MSSIRNSAIIASAIVACLFFTNRAAGLDAHKAITQFTHRSWTAADGISAVFSIAQTTDGYIWLATSRGTFRFDGLKFTRLESDLNGPRPSGGFYHLLGAKDGSLWISRGEFIARYKAGKLIVYGANEGFNGHTGKICEDGDGAIWVQTQFGLARFAAEKWQFIGEEHGLPKGDVHALMVDHENTLWVALQTSQSESPFPLAFLRHGETQFQVFGYAGTIANSLAEAPNRSIWTAQTGRSVRAFAADRSALRFIPPEIKVGSAGILFDRDGAFWISTGGDGLRRVRDTATLGDNDVGQFSDEVDKFTQKDGLSSDTCSTVFEDREGNIWTGTSSGLDCFSETKVTSLSNREGLPFDQNLWLESTRDGSIWAGSSPRGIVQIKYEESQFLDHKWFDVKALGNTVLVAYSIYKDSDDSLILGTGLGVIMLRHSDGSAFLLPGAEQLKTVTAVTRDQAGDLWLCNGSAIYRLHGAQLEKVSDPLLANGVVFAAYTDGVGRVWLCFQFGAVACYEAGRFTRYSAKDGVLPGAVTGILSDPKGQIWVTGIGGISRFSNGRFQTLTRDNGLPDEEVFAALRDDDGYFWLGGWSGLFRVASSELESALSAQSGRVKGELFDLRDGLRGPIHGVISHYGKAGCTKDSAGRLWFATGTGLVIVDPHHISRNLLSPLVHVQQVAAAGRTYQSLEGLELPVGTRDCEIDYVGLSYVNPAKVNYQYKLDGYDQEWIEAGSRRQAFYSHLKPGNYQFHLRACNNDGVWCEKGDAIKFGILPAFYERTWFFVLCGILLGVGLWGLHRLRLVRLAARLNLQLEGQRRERKRIAQELHDTLLQGFTGLGLKLDAITNRLPDSLGEAKEQLRKILEQSDQYLAEARRSVWELRATSLERTGDFRTSLVDAIGRILDGTEIRLKFSVEGERRDLPAVVEDNLLRISEEAVTNVVKHAHATEVQVGLEFDSRVVRLRVRDNGVGFDPKGLDASRAGHFGLAGIRERAEAIGGNHLLASNANGTDLLVTVITGSDESKRPSRSGKRK